MTDTKKQQDILRQIADWQMKNPDPNAADMRQRLAASLATAGVNHAGVGYGGRPLIEADAHAKQYLIDGAQYGPTEYYMYSSDTGKETFVGLMNEKGEVFSCERTAEGDFIVKGTDGKEQVWMSGENTVKREGKAYHIQQFDYHQGCIIDRKMTYCLPDSIKLAPRGHTR